MGKFLGLLILFLGSQAAAQTVFLKGYGLTPLTAPNLARGMLSAVQQQAQPEQALSPEISGIRILDIGIRPFHQFLNFALGSLKDERVLPLEATLIAVVGGQPQIHYCHMDLALNTSAWLEVTTCSSQDGLLFLNPFRLAGEQVGLFSTTAPNTEPATTTDPATKIANSNSPM